MSDPSNGNHHHHHHHCFHVIVIIVIIVIVIRVIITMTIFALICVKPRVDNEGPHQGESVIHDSVKLGIQGHTLDDDDDDDDD